MLCSGSADAAANSPSLAALKYRILYLSFNSLPASCKERPQEGVFL